MDHTKADCPQTDRLMRLEEELANHKQWRKETSSLLSDIHLQTAAQTERLRFFTDKVSDQNQNRDRWDSERDKKIEEHIKDGNAFRLALFFTAIGLIATVVAGFIGYGKLEQKVEFVYEQAKTK